MTLFPIVLRMQNHFLRRGNIEILPGNILTHLREIEINYFHRTMAKQLAATDRRRRIGLVTQYNQSRICTFNIPAQGQQSKCQQSR